MSPKYSYLILGAGKQGLAAAYDAILHGEAKNLLIADCNRTAALNAARKIRRLLNPVLSKSKVKLSSVQIDIGARECVRKALKNCHAVLSALPYYLNLAAAEEAIRAKVHYCDLGGYFEITQKILKLDARAKRARVTLVPDCGVSPGLCNVLALCAIEQLDSTKDIYIYCGGLPLKPKPPLDYKAVFNLEGVLGNYFGKSYVLRNGKIRLIPSFSEREELDFRPAHRETGGVCHRRGHLHLPMDF